MFTIRQTTFAFAVLSVLVYATVLRAFTVDTPLFGIAAFVVMLVLALLGLGLGRDARLNPDANIVLLFLFVLDAVVYLVHYEGIETLAHMFRFFAPVVYFLAFRVLLDREKVTWDIFRFFRAVFVVESLFMLIEVVDGALGFDVHATQLIGYFIESDERFELITPPALASPLAYLPPVLGIHGFPHYTAPIYMVSFLFTLAQTVSPRRAGGRLSRRDQWKAATVLFVGMFCIYMLGVKTHFITGAITIGLLALALRRRLLWSVGVSLLVLISGTLASPAATERFRNLIDQTFVGTAEAGGSRLEVIFNLGEYRTIFERSTWEVIVGTGEFEDMLNLTEQGYFLEQRFLIVILVFGLPYLFLLVGFFGKGWHSCWRVYRGTVDPQVRACAVAIGCSFISYFLELFHYGFTLSSPNFQFFFMMLAAITVLEGGLRIVAQERRGLPHVGRQPRATPWHTVPEATR